jgi:putative MATE family efflux protein
MDKNLLRNFTKYVSLNILGMIGLSFYILADTYFVSKALGSTGIAALNLSISIYSVIHGIGLMIGIGGATRFSILKSQNVDKKANLVFVSAIKLGAMIGVIIAIIGLFGAKHLALLLGADSLTLPLTRTYLSTILSFAPFFILNNVILAFIRNDNNPKLSMIAMLVGSFSNIVLDYVFMFPLGMGIFGAAFATGLAPIFSIFILSFHFVKKKNSFTFLIKKLRWNFVPDIFRLGLSAFIIEISSAVVLITFNLVMLRIEGNLGVAAYGIVANLALVGIAVFTGLAQGIQPLISKYYGMENYNTVRKLR